jgi:molybdenum cofactor biosynthesis enzyme MoaA
VTICANPEYGRLGSLKAWHEKLLALTADRCNLRCTYCMIEHMQFLSLETVR